MHWDEMIPQMDAPAQLRLYHSVLGVAFSPGRIAELSGDLLEATTEGASGTTAMAEFVRSNRVRKRVWRVETPDAERGERGDDIGRREALLNSFEDFSNVRLFWGPLGDHLGGMGRFCCAILRDGEPNDWEGTWERVVPGGLMVVHHGEEGIASALSIEELLGERSCEIERSGKYGDEGKLVWAVKAGGPRERGLEANGEPRKDLPRIVVASYGEDLTWTRDLWLPTVIYDATGRSTLAKARPILNRGREAGQYLHHIVSHYPDFHEWEVFLQGRPFDHLSAQLPDLFARVAEWEDFQPLAPLVPFDERHYVHDEWAGQFAREWFGEVPTDLHWVPGAQFAVKREVLLSKPLDYWERLQQKVLEEERRSPWAIERLWMPVFLEGR